MESEGDWIARSVSRAVMETSFSYWLVRRKFAPVGAEGATKALSLVDTIREMQKSGIAVHGIEIGLDRAQPVAPHGANRNWAMVLGNEDVGLSSETAAVCDKICYIPQAHGDSLNVGHAAAIAMFELGRECPPEKHDGLAECA